MHDEYFETHFRVGFATSDESWMAEFSIISAYATTGERWSDEQNGVADQKLEEELRRRAVWLRRVVGYSPMSSHAEPSWAAAVPFEEACKLGLQFKQDAIYHVMGDALSVSYCDDRRQLVTVGGFRDRLHVSEERAAAEPRTKV